jgi:acyl-coenzyme A thioesterase PaaI-like protein
VPGGAIATLIDTVVVPALAWVYDEVPKLLTVTLNIRFRGALFEEDAVAEGWIDTRGRTTVFCSAEVVGATSGRVVADGQLVYKVPPPS